MSVGGAGFVPFLNQDNQDLTNTQTQQVIQAIDQDLAQLLRLPPQQFWHVVTSDDSLHTCLDSFLRFRRRCYDDEDPDSIQGSSDVLLQLSQRVFRVYWRMLHPQERSTSAGPSKGQQPAAPDVRQVADLLYNKWLMDVPKMMDMAVLFGPGNTQLVQQLLHQLLMLQPRYAQDVFNLSLPLTSNLHELLESVKQLGTKLLSGSTAADAASKTLLPELAEAVSYFMDACLTLQALAEVLPEAAALLLHPHHHGEVLIVLAAIYSSTVPLLRRVSQQPAAAAVPGLAPARINRLQQCLESLVFHLLRSAYCTKEGALAAGGPEAVAAQAAAAAGGSAGSSSAAGSSRKPPPGFGSSSSVSGTGFSAEIQGQELMNLLMLLAHPTDGVHGVADGLTGNLLAAVNHNHHLDVAVSQAVSQGLLALDDAQFDYFLALVDGDRQLLQQRQEQQQQQRLGQGTAASSSNSTHAAAAAAAAGSGSSMKQPGAAELGSMVSSVKELLPDYGDGFVAAVLHHNSYNTEQTINCLLEGSLPKAVQALDPSLKAWSPPASSSNGLSWTGLAAEAAAAALPVAVERIPLPSLTAAAAAAASGPKAGVDKRTQRVLGALPGKLRSMTKNIAQEMQYEYEDEYDDSFDDLMGPGNDGVCDIEGEDTGAGSAAAAAARAGAASSSSAAAAAGGGVDEYADEPLAQGPPASARQTPQQQRGRQQRKEKLWVLDGKVYNYKKEGAQEVEGHAGAHAALKAAQAAALEINGLGPGGNVPLPQPEQQQRTQGAAAAAAAAALAGGNRGDRPAAGRGGAPDGPGRGGGGGGRGRGRGGQHAADGAADGGGGRGRGRGSYAHKEQHKAAAGNHHRRDRAMQKMSKGML